MSQKKKKLLDMLRDKIIFKGYSRSTEKTYVYWNKGFILFHDKGDATLFPGGFIISSVRPNLNKVYKADFDGICSTDILVFRANNEKLTNFYKYYFLSKVFNESVLKTVSGQQLPRTSWNKINSFKIPIPSLSEQKTLVSKIEKLENRINEAKEIINTSAEKKQKIMDKYLK